MALSLTVSSLSAATSILSLMFSCSSKAARMAIWSSLALLASRLLLAASLFFPPPLPIMIILFLFWKRISNPLLCFSLMMSQKMVLVQLGTITVIGAAVAEEVIVTDFFSSNSSFFLDFFDSFFQEVAGRSSITSSTYASWSRIFIRITFLFLHVHLESFAKVCLLL